MYAPPAWGYNKHMGTEVIPKLTFEQFRELPSDGKRYELVHGEVHVTPSPATRHQFTLQNLLRKLRAVRPQEPLGRGLPGALGRAPG